MRRFRTIALVSAIILMAAPGQSAVPLGDVVQVLGSVTNAARPVANALVIALNLSNFDAIQTFSTSDGTFILPPLRTGVYKIIAVKQGLVPAIAMLVPTRADNRVNLRMKNERAATRVRNSESQEMWEIRGSLPPDVLREVDMVLEPPVAMASASYNVPRFKGEMMSVTGVADQSASPATAQTALGVSSRIGDNWQLGFRGNLRRIDDPNDDARFGAPLAQASTMQMELRSGPGEDSYRLGSTQSSWRYRDDDAQPSQQADVRSHNFEWQHGDARVQVRYLAQQNLFRANPLGSDLIEIAGNTTVFQSGRSDLGVGVRVTQESMRSASSTAVRLADVTADGAWETVPAFLVRYGMTSRIGVDGTEWAPRTGVEWRLGKEASFVASGLYKVLNESKAPTLAPSLVDWSDQSSVLPRYSYSFGLISNGDSKQRFSAIATVTAIDSPLRVLVNDGVEQFWDGFYIDRGDVRRDLRFSYSREIGGLAVDLSTGGGVATPTGADLNLASKQYLTGDLQSTWRPTGTSVMMSYRHLRQPPMTQFGQDYRSERMNVRMSQSLHLPLDLKLLLGMEVTRAANSPFLLDSYEPDGSTRKYLGGLAVNF